MTKNRGRWSGNSPDSPKRAPRLGADFRVRVLRGKLAELPGGRRRKGAVPRPLAGYTAQGVGRIAPHPRHRVAKRGRERGQRLGVAEVVEQGDAPPANLGAGIADPVGDCVKDCGVDPDPAELSGGYAADQTPDRIQPFIANG